MDCIFCKIINREIPAKIVFEDELSLAFHDINPQAPVHILVIPKEHFASLKDSEESHEAAIGYVMRKCAEVAAHEGIAESGFRTVINTGSDAQQSVFHLHVHLLGGKPMGWNPA
jgi:histidine triad (HIT) family protein